MCDIGDISEGFLYSALCTVDQISANLLIFEMSGEPISITASLTVHIDLQYLIESIYGEFLAKYGMVGAVAPTREN